MHLTSPIRGNGVGFHVEYARYCFEERSVVVLWASVRVEAEAACLSPILAVELPAAWVQVGLHGNHGHIARKKKQGKKVVHAIEVSGLGYVGNVAVIASLPCALF